MHGKDEIIWSYETCATVCRFWVCSSTDLWVSRSEVRSVTCSWSKELSKSSAGTEVPDVAFFFWHDWCNCYHTYVHSTAECSLCKAVIWNLCINNVVANRADAWGDDGPACSWSSVRHSVTAWHSKIGVPCLGGPWRYSKAKLAGRRPFMVTPIIGSQRNSGIGRIGRYLDSYTYCGGPSEWLVDICWLRTLPRTLAQLIDHEISWVSIRDYKK